MQVIGMYLWGLRGRDFSTAKGLKSAEVLHQIYPAGLPTATRALFARGAFRRMPTPEVCIAGSMLSAAIQPLRSRDLRRLKAVAVAHTNLEPWGP